MAANIHEEWDEEARNDEVLSTGLELKAKMKFDKVYELEPPSDLSYHSFLEALRILALHHPKQKYDFHWYHLFVASQNFATAHDVIGERANTSVEIDFSYKPDEWGLCIVGYIHKENKSVKCMAHSCGA